MRYGIQTTNHAECFNMVMRCCRGFPLVGIVEFIMYGCMKYFRERYMAATINMSNPQIQFCTRVTQYMQDKIAKARQHRVISTGTREHRFEVLCKDRTSRGIRRDRVVQESLIRADGTTPLHLHEAKVIAFALFARHCHLCRIWVAARSICVTLFQQGGSYIHLGT